MNKNWEKFLTFSKLEALKKQEILENKFEINKLENYELNDSLDEITFKKNNDIEIKASIMVVGLISKQPNLWYWATDVNSLELYSSNQLYKLKDVGRKYNFKALINSCWKANEDDGIEMISIATKILNSEGFFILKSDNVDYYLVLNNIQTINTKKKKLKNKR